MGCIQILYYPNGDNGPVKEALEAVVARKPKAFLRLARDLEILGAEGTRSGRIGVRPLGEGLWELKRTFDKIDYRILFGFGRSVVWLVDFFEKQTARTPAHILERARKRLGMVSER